MFFPSAMGVGPAPSFDPVSLFGSGENGWIINPQDNSLILEDTSADTAEVGDTVLKINSPVNSVAFTVVPTKSGPVYQQDANGRFYLDFDGSTDVMQTASTSYADDSWSCYVGYSPDTLSATHAVVDKDFYSGTGFVRVAQYLYVVDSSGYKSRVVQFRNGGNSQALSTGTLSAGSKYVLKTKGNESAATVRAGIDGTWGTETTGATAPFVTSSKETYVGAGIGTPIHSYADGKLYYALFINRILTDTEDDLLDRYIGRLIGKTI